MSLRLQALITAALAAIFFSAGWWLRGVQTKAATVDQVQVRAKADVRQAERTSEAVQAHAEAKAKTEIRYVTTVKEVEKLVERPVYLERCLDDDGLRALNAQITGANTQDTGPALPNSGDAAGHDGG